MSFYYHTKGFEFYYKRIIDDYFNVFARSFGNYFELQTVTLFRPIRSLWSPTALKRPDRSKQCHCLQFAKCIAGLLHYYTYFELVSKLFHANQNKSNVYMTLYENMKSGIK